ncbi:D-sedoheptulose 7-phosphate isomerase [bacterium]|nr:D-sedoheptulose 7-phosphate isomerase [bacterium]
MVEKMEDIIRRLILESIQVKHAFLEKSVEDVAKAANIIIDALKDGKKVLFFGNGGSAADAQHLAGEFVNRFLYDRPALPGIALTTDSSVLTCIANDSDYRFIFSRQIEAIGKAGDVAIGISTSGSSPNVVEGMKRAKEMAISTIAFIGSRRGAVADHSDIVISVPSPNTPRIQEAHIMAGHIICQLVEDVIFPKAERGCG